jgi:dihydrofolate reductase
VYKQAINIADEMIISIIKLNAEGDVYFPKIDPEIWKEASRDKREQFDIITYVKK